MPLRLLVLLHGFEDEPDRWLDAVGPIGVAGDPSVELLVPRGPHQQPGGPSWLPGHEPDELTVTATLDDLDRQIEAARGRIGCALGEVVVGGFSQGAGAALALALRDREPEGGSLLGCFAVCGMLWPPETVSYDFAAADRTSFLIVHGSGDETVPVQQGRSAARVLERHGLAARYCEHDGAGHDLDAAYLGDVSAWLAELTGA